MILMDTDHLTVLGFPQDRRHAALSARVTAADSETFAITVVNVAEPLRGWLAEINRQRDVHGKILPFAKLGNLIQFFAQWRIVTLDERAADQFEELRHRRIRLGTMGLLIASIALVQDALLISANLSDFRKVPNLRVANWLTE